MALKLFHFPGNEPVGATPSLHLVPGLLDGSKKNISQILDFADANWIKGVGNSIVGGLFLSDQLDDVFAVGQGQPTKDSVEYSLRNGIPGYDRYIRDYTAPLQALSDAGYVIDNIALDIEGDSGIGKSRVFTNDSGSFTMLDVLTQAYASDPTGLPHINLTSLAKDEFSGGRGGYLANRFWSGWSANLTAKAFKRVFSDTAKAIFGKQCVVTNYDWAEYDHTPIIDWPTQGNSAARHSRPQINLDDVGAPVLYLNRRYFDTVEEALNALDCCTFPCRPWIGGPDRTTDESDPGFVDGVSENWNVNGPANYTLMLAGIEEWYDAQPGVTDDDKVVGVF